MVIYGGDEVSAVVLDVGTSTTRAGYAGEDAPRAVVPTAYGYLAGNDSNGDSAQNGNGDAMQVESEGHGEGRASKASAGQYFLGDAAGPSMYRTGMTVHNPVREGVIEDWDAMERIVEHSLRAQMRLPSLEEHPLLISEPSWQNKENRERWTELAFEGWGAPAFYSVDKNVLTSFSVGKGTSLILDVGEDSTSCVPIYDGFVIRKGIQKSPLGGSLLTSYLSSAFRSSSPPITVRPHYLIKDRPAVASNTPSRATPREGRAEGATESFAKYAESQTIHNFKESLLQVNETGPYDEASLSQRPARPYEFPDGYNTTFGTLRYRVPEVMFNPTGFLPSEFLSAPSPAPTSSSIPTPPLSQAVPLQQMVLNALRSTDVDLHPTLLQNIVVVGGSTFIPGFLDRLSLELSRLPLGSGAKPKFEAPGTTVGRKYAPWLGGSILGSLGTFHQLWIGREEYMEYGKSVVHRRAR